jgi:hypothetical protein
LRGKAPSCPDFILAQNAVEDAHLMELAASRPDTQIRPHAKTTLYWREVRRGIDLRSFAPTALCSRSAPSDRILTSVRKRGGVHDTSIFAKHHKCTGWMWPMQIGSTSYMHGCLRPMRSMVSPSPFGTARPRLGSESRWPAKRPQELSSLVTNGMRPYSSRHALLCILGWPAKDRLSSFRPRIPAGIQYDLRLGYEFRCRGRSAAQSSIDRCSLGFSVKSREVAECILDGTRQLGYSRTLSHSIHGK